MTWLVGRKQSNLKYCGLGSNSNRINFILFHLTLKYNCIWVVCMGLHPVMLVCACVIYINLYIKRKRNSNLDSNCELIVVKYCNQRHNLFFE